MGNQINSEDKNIQQIGQNPINQPSIIPVSEKPKTNYWMVSTIALFIIVLLGGAYLFSNTNTKKSQKPSITENATLTKPTPTTSVAPTAIDWTNYQNSHYNFEFQYPTGFMLQETSGEARDYNGNVSLADFKTTDGKELAVLLDNNSFSVNYLKKYAPTGSEEISPELKTLGKSSFYYYGPGGGGVCYPDQYFTNLSGKILIFIYTGCDNDKTPSKETKITEEQILTTLKIGASTNTKTENQIGYIKTVSDQNGRKSLSIDYIQWLSQADGSCRSESESNSNIPVCNPNGYLIVNSNSQIRTFEISNNVIIDFSDFKNADLGWKDNQQLTTSYLTLSDFLEIFSGNNSSIKWLKDAVYRVEIVDNKIIKIRYQYQP